MENNELRKLDEWIAAKIFGWQQFREEEHPNRMLWREGEAGSDVWDEPHFYTTDPAAAMEVLEKCAEKQALIGEPVGVARYEKDSGRWTVESNVRDYGDAQYIFSEADTLPLAISKFAREIFKEEK